MVIRINLATRLIVLYQLQLFGLSKAALQHLPWKNADKLINAVFPNTNICELNQDDGMYEKQNACCDDCTCKENYDTISKCFMSTSETETCVRPNTKQVGSFIGINQKELRDAYLMITRSPTNGCVDDEIPPCNDDNIMELSPESSRETNKTYFNEECAACHGISIVHHWYRAMVCNDFDDNSQINFDQELQKFLENPVSSLCFIHFAPHPLVSAKKCSVPQKLTTEPLTTDFSNENHTEKSLYGMSINEIADACISNFYSPVFDVLDRKWFQNPFCYILVTKSEKEAKCHMTSTPGSSEYMALLDPKAMDNLGTPKAELPKPNKVCLSAKYDKKNNQVCNNS